ncbi:hypothetical protein K469DRAFT_716654 [Zopfia rhizophila CBS 207.26]|uniref:Uncharacterized protein n=1 Tax=Zopfia rhizophila CBS 207.26 TaxID=1314779 RepID=A0A6A6EN20_9PEZI|nr:hypothetical protein K469DRAFT_716654 [Zopfia rhizophila CBS 207.26]
MSSPHCPYSSDTCNVTITVKHLASCDHLPAATLDNLVSACRDNICNIVYGSGNADLSGIGVVVSYALQLGIATIYGLWLLVEDCLIPAFGRRVTARTRVANILKKTQQKALWSQLLFCFSIVCATCVRNFRNAMGVFESSNINGVVAVTFMALTLTLAPVHREIDRKKLFLFCLLCTSLTSLLSSFVRLYLADELHNIFEACNRNIKRDAKAWTSSALLLIDEQHRAVSAGYLAVMVFFVLIWFLLWSIESVCPEQPENKRIWIKRTLISLQVLTSIVIVQGSWSAFNHIIAARAFFNLITSGFTEENEWGIGQIIAPFAWVPLLVDIVYAAISETQQEAVQVRNGQQ